jgi:hypothetical protein
VLTLAPEPKREYCVLSRVATQPQPPMWDRLHFPGWDTLLGSDSSTIHPNACLYAVTLLQVQEFL